MANSFEGQLLTQRNITIIVAIVIAIPVSFLFQSAFPGTAGSFLLLLTVGVSVPKAYDEYWPAYRQTWKAVVWIGGATAMTTVEFSGLFLLGSEVATMSASLSAGVAFLVVHLGNWAWLTHRIR
jgi:hypothetical protein